MQSHLSDDVLSCQALLVFNADLVKRIAEGRFADNYVGQRRVRPSSKSVREALKSAGKKEKSRNNSQTSGYHNSNNPSAKRQKVEQTRDVSTGKIPVLSSASESSGDLRGKSPDLYHTMEVPSKLLEQELAEMLGARNGVPPALLSSPMTLLVLRQGILGSRGDSSFPADKQRPQTFKVAFDRQLSEEWAKRLKHSMAPAEVARTKEDLRPMPYQLVPEAWNRLCPESLLQGIVEDEIRSNHAQGKMENSSLDYQFVTVRKSNEISSPYDIAATLVFQLLHEHTGLHVSCGAKFGCDFLVYDGPRDKRHAFAGLRILQAEKMEPEQAAGTKNGTWQLPIGTAYSMSGYVRCLNTAGKLALLATVIAETEPASGSTIYRIAIVDLALEKILTAPTHQRYNKGKNARREVGLNLDK